MTLAQADALVSSHFYILIAFSLVGLYISTIFSRRRRLPAGPPRRIPWLGNALQMTTESQWLQFDKLTKTYGDVVYLEAFGQPMVILGSLDACIELFDKRSANYSDRPDVPMLTELMGWDWATSNMRYGPKWRAYRRTFHQHFHAGRVDTYRNIQRREARVLTKKLHEDPNGFMQHLRHAVGAVIMEGTYGIHVAEHNDPYIMKAEEAMVAFSLAANPSTYLINIFPQMKHIPAWFPGAQFKRDAAKWRKIQLDMITAPFDRVTTEMRRGTAPPSVLRAMLERIRDGKGGDEDEELAKGVAGVAYSAGADTSTSAVQTFILGMATSKEAQVKAQKEIDAVTGGTRLPDFDDRDSLPYIRAICKEVTRWQPVVPLAVVHTSVADDEYRGWHFPKGTYFFGNAWSILHDPVEYPDPERFNPDRFFKDGRFNTEIRDPDLAAFGYGRRMCPGRWFADNTVWIIVASVLAVYNIEPPQDDNGRPVQLKPEMSGGVVSLPAPFQCIIKPRSQTAEQLIRGMNLNDVAT